MYMHGIERHIGKWVVGVRKSRRVFVVGSTERQQALVLFLT